MENRFSNTMDYVNEMVKSHGVTMNGGKIYLQVVHRMEVFRRFHGIDYGVDTKVLVDDGHRVVVKATITNSNGVQIGSGMAEEIRGQGHVNKTSALENCETSAIGRALSSIGLAGGEYASANEIEAVPRKQEAMANPDPLPQQTSTPTKEQEAICNEFLAEVEKQLTLSPDKVIAWCNTDYAKEGMEKLKSLYPDIGEATSLKVRKYIKDNTKKG